MFPPPPLDSSSSSPKRPIPNRITPEQENEIVRLTGDGLGSHVIAKRVKVSQTTVLRVWRRKKIDREKLIARNKLVEDHTTLAVRIARSVASSLPLHMRDELPAVARTALIQAAETFDAAFNVPFAFYMQQRVRGACVDSVRRRHYRNSNAAGLDQETSEARQDTEASIEQQLIADEALAAQKVRAVDAIGRLPGRLAVLVWLHYIEGQTLEAIAPKFGVVSSRVSQLHREALTTLRNQGEQGRLSL
jgi:RNA polymerase sigma factor (sigma-70 family)